MSKLEEFSGPKDDLLKAPVYDAVALTKNTKQAFIKLDNQIYHLRITRAGKLILTK